MLRGTSQQILKGVHLSCAALNLGGTAGLLGILLVVGKTPQASALLLVLFDWLVAPAYYGLLGTGIIYSLFTSWGFARFYWIVLKWLLALALFVATTFVLAPALTGTGAYAGAVAGNAQFAIYRTSAIGWTGVSLVVLFVIVFVSTLKPWGRIEREWQLSRQLQLLLVIGTAGMAAGMGVYNHLLLSERRRLPIASADFRKLRDGKHLGVARFEFPYAVELEVRSGRLVAARMRANRDSEYARFAEQVLERVVQAQSLQVDAVSGATTTSVAILKAAEAAVRAGVVRD